MPETDAEVIKRLEGVVERYKAQNWELEKKLKAEAKKRYELEEYVHSIAKFVSCAQSFIDRGCI